MESTTPTTTTQNKVISKSEADNVRKRIEGFVSVMNRAPRVIKSNDFAGGAKYVPIEEMEMALDEFFVGQWETRAVGQGAKLIGNAIVYDIELRVLHPVTGNWLTRCGTGSCKIELQATRKDKQTGKVYQQGAAHALDFEKMNASALERNVPAAKAMAFRNACLSLGKLFGRDLNRDEGRSYNPIYSNAMAARKEASKS